MTINKIKKVVTIYKFAASYHSGQWSRGYKLCCTAGRWLDKYYPEFHSLQARIGRSRRLFSLLVKQYAHKM